MKYVIFSHGHPTFSKGGAEIAAYNLFKGINQIPGHKCWFVARCPDQMLHLGSPIAAINEQELLIAGGADMYHLASTIRLGDDSDFAAMLRSINPDVVHFHHYVNLGVEMLYAVRRVLPSAKIFLTLHEYMAICSNSGQMMKTNGTLCHKYSPRECAQCFPKITPEDFFLREQYIKSFFKNVDFFISPSNFLKNRYIAWGIEESRIHVIENGQNLTSSKQSCDTQKSARNVFGFFGQINPTKGVDILLQAIASLSLKQRKKIILEIHGANLELQSKEFKKKINQLLKPLQEEGTVRWVGPYQQHEIHERMTNVDWVVVPSIWWENSPMVIQEAMVYHRPLLVSNIGGMVEKVEHNINGLHVTAGSIQAWASTILRCVEDPQLWENLKNGIKTPISISDCAQRHIALVNE